MGVEGSNPLRRSMKTKIVEAECIVDCTHTLDHIEHLVNIIYKDKNIWHYAGASNPNYQEIIRLIKCCNDYNAPMV